MTASTPCPVDGCGMPSWNATGMCAKCAHPSAQYRPDPALEVVAEGEWRERSALEDPAHVEAEWRRTFAAADARTPAGRLHYPRPSWFYQ